MRKVIARPTVAIWIALALASLPWGCGSEQSQQGARKPAPAVTDDPPPDRPPPPAYVPRPTGSLTFAKDIAPIVLQKCAGCHHEGEAAPFPLLTYGDVRKRAKQIVQVTGSRFMPPWAPVAGYCDFVQDRSLSNEEIGRIAQWTKEGCAPGSPSDLPPIPKFPHGWRNGKPDLVVTMPKPYMLAAQGRDIYRKVVLRVPITEAKYVRAVELDPGNRKVVHHAMIRIDRTGWSRYLDERDPLPGFEGTLTAGDHFPDGFIMGWSPGYEPPTGVSQSAWRLDPGVDLVVELHLNSSGKPEPVQCSVALFFTPDPPKDYPCIVQLENGTIDIPAGKKDYIAEDEYVLPVEAAAVSNWPHAHYLCREMQVYAIKPDGTKTWLLRITDWDFNWQNVYLYAKPPVLPKGTRLRMRFRYDNSADNLRNPNNPPKRVHFGRNTDNEMGDVTFIFQARNEEEAKLLRSDFSMHDLKTSFAFNNARLQLEPDNWEAHYNLGVIYDQLDDFQKSLYHYQRSVRSKPDNLWAHNNLGTAYLNCRRVDEAIGEFNQALRIEPNDSKAHNNLGLAFLVQGKLDPAAAQFETALHFNSNFPEAETNLGVVELRKGNRRQAASHFERALQLNPEYQYARQQLAELQSAAMLTP
jgi:tetratricopeptide (TPR) repeat protein